MHDFIEYDLIPELSLTEQAYREALNTKKLLDIWLYEEKMGKHVIVEIKSIESKKGDLTIKGTAFNGKHRIEIDYTGKKRKIKLFRAGL